MIATTATADAPEATADKGSRGAPAARPFVAGARETTRPFHDRTSQLETSSQSVGPVDIVAHGFMRHVVLVVEATGGAAGGTNAVAKENAPFSVLANVTLHDVSGNPIVNLTGYELYLANKYGAYQFLTDPKSSPVYSAVATSGNFTFILRVPVEVSRRDGFGALVNQNAGQTYKLSYEVAGAGSVYSTSPGTLPEVRVRAYLEAYTRANAADFAGVPFAAAPPGHGSVQFWRHYVANIGPGAQTIRLPHVGNHIRNIIAVCETSSARSTSDFPTDVSLEVDGNVLDSVARDLLRHRVAERYGFDGAVAAAGGLDTGVFVWDFCHDLDGKPGFETRDGYLPTTQATNLELRGVFGASAARVTFITNDIAVQAAA